jgi:hypothetical protein
LFVDTGDVASLLALQPLLRSIIQRMTSSASSAASGASRSTWWRRWPPITAHRCRSDFTARVTERGDEVLAAIAAQRRPARRWCATPTGAASGRRH